MDLTKAAELAGPIVSALLAGLASAWLLSKFVKNHASNDLLQE